VTVTTNHPSNTFPYFRSSDNAPHLKQELRADGVFPEAKKNPDDTQTAVEIPKRVPELSPDSSPQSERTLPPRNIYTPGTGALHGGCPTDCRTSPPHPGPSSPSGGDNHPHQRYQWSTRDSQRKDSDRHKRVRDGRRPLPQAVTSPSKTPCEVTGVPLDRDDFVQILHSRASRNPVVPDCPNTTPASSTKPDSPATAPPRPPHDSTATSAWRHWSTNRKRSTTPPPISVSHPPASGNASPPAHPGRSTRAATDSCSPHSSPTPAKSPTSTRSCRRLRRTCTH